MASSRSQTLLRTGCGGASLFLSRILQTYSGEAGAKLLSNLRKGDPEIPGYGFSAKLDLRNGCL